MKVSNLLVMGGWKTWTAAAGLVLLAVADVANGDIEAAGTKVMAALGLVGLGHKVDKGNQSING